MLFQNQNTKLSPQKITCTVFWDRQGRLPNLLVEFHSRGETINDALCCFLTTHDPILLVPLWTLLKYSVGSSLITHPPYSSDIAPSDYYFFLNLKPDFGGNAMIAMKMRKTVFISSFFHRRQHLSMKRVGYRKIDIPLRRNVWTM